MDPIIEYFLDGGIDGNVVLGVVEALAEPLNIIDKEVKERKIICRNKSYYDETIKRYDDVLFKEHFRMSRTAFETLMEQIIQRRPNLVKNVEIALDKKILFTLWILTTQESFFACGNRFGIARSSGYYVFKEIVSILIEMLPRHIMWPENHDTHIQKFQELSRGFPGVVGAIDCCHIKIKQPSKDSHDYCNRNKYFSIILQGTVDPTLKFIDVFVGLPGSMSNASVFRKSDIYQKITDHDNPLLPHNLHILGDSAYPLMPNVLTPFRDNRQLSARERKYNTKLSSVRSVIQRAFGRLVAKFHRLKNLDVCDAEVGTQVIAASCVLHNFIINEDNEEEGHEYENGVQSEDDNENYPRENRQFATIKRNEIMYRL